MESEVKWVKCSERMPEKMGDYIVWVVTPAVTAWGLWEGRPPVKHMQVGCYRQEKKFDYEDEERVVHKKVKGFYWSVMERYYELENVEMWLEVEPPEGEG